MGDQTRPPPVTSYPAGPANQNGYPPPSSGTAYPNAAPPPAAYNYNYYNNNNPYYQQPDAYAAQRATFLRRVLAIFIACFVIAGTVIFIVWLILRPRLPEVRVDSFSVSSFNLSDDNFLSGNWDFQFTARNPNKKMTIDYDDIQASIYYDSKQLAETSVAPFFQEKRSKTASKATFAATRTFVDDWVVEGIKKETPNVEFDVVMLARVRFKAGSWRARSRFLRVYCGDLKVGLAQNKSSGNLVGGPRQCIVRI